MKVELEQAENKRKAEFLHCLKVFTLHVGVLFLKYIVVVLQVDMYMLELACRS